MDPDDVHWMHQALELARRAADNGEVPVGALVVRGGDCLGRAGNQPIGLADPTAHAEILALREAAQREGNYRLPGSTVYVTLEPCGMCIGAMIHARVERVVFGAYDPKTGAAGSAADLVNLPMHNHRLQVTGGVLSQACGDLLRDFFRSRRGRRS
ncbi:tRNA adenosine(34) deaminase TadA [Ectothiorhodospira sp. BSL-9]|uniref:tRNA adenosine(34) deaminase TadA n=1 Tax=Ectothiorhodospira sp. BSL-9 TaxID=1442136 RepID=UPI0007B44C09|nr:tRNA adenosine(34) deaminase TadA [Ectothiorhodospira sp. BSL-9]ANB01052.1 hypothetical protein ECTOBSL9_0075 [Ectothiorhodospira sp. BSL-9]